MGPWQRVLINFEDSILEIGQAFHSRDVAPFENILDCVHKLWFGMRSNVKQPRYK